ncbi:MAG: CoA transferase subunit A [Candidatus Helarchaeota archaeon]
MVVDKIMSLSEAISTFVDDGDLIGIGGLSFWRKAVAATHEIIRQKKKKLGALSFVGGVCIDSLVGAGCIDYVRSCFVSFELFGLAPNFRKAVEKKYIKIFEETEATLALGLKAVYLRLPFMPLKGVLQTDILKVRDDIKEMDDPLKGEKLVAVPAIQVDTAIMHVPYCDEKGNAAIAGTVWLDDDIAKTAKKTIITCEKIVETEDIVRMQGKAAIPMQKVDAVVRVPFGAHPTSCYPFYTMDATHIKDYIKISLSDGGFKSYQATYIDNKNQQEYLEAVGGVKTIFNILI